jgi:hypothetical protein
VGDQDLLRHVEQAGAAVGDTDLSLSRFATGAPFRGGGSLLFSAVALLEFIRGYVVVASIGQRFPLSCNSFQGAHALKALPKRFTPSALPQPLAKIIDVESNAAQRSHQRYHPHVSEFAVRPAPSIPGAAAGNIWLKAPMHFGFYLMIAALVLMGVEVGYALYQLATIVL